MTSSIPLHIILLLTNKLEMTYNLGIVLFVFLAYGLLGFIDDYLIIRRHNNFGLTELQKLIGQILIAVVFFILFRAGGREPVLEIYTFGITINLGWFYWLLILLMLVATTNAVNLTDGLDGLAGGLSAIAFLAFGMIAWASLGIEGSEDIGVFCFILVGALIAFCFFNTYPAKVFMGDTGSLALGGVLGAVSVATKQELLLAIAGGIFVVEALSDIIQVGSYKLRGKRVFLMAPIHHHFEKKGWSETTVVVRFWIISILLALLALSTLKIR